MAARIGTLEIVREFKAREDKADQIKIYFYPFHNCSLRRRKLRHARGLGLESCLLLQLGAVKMLLPLRLQMGRGHGATKKSA